MKIVGVIGAGRAEEELLKIAERVGSLLAKNGLILINGGLGGVRHYNRNLTDIVKGRC